MAKKQSDGGLVQVKDLVTDFLPELLLMPDEQPKPIKPTSKRTIKRSNRLVAIREDREEGKPQQFGYLARPFILCGLPFKKPQKGVSYYKRQNGNHRPP